jgi:hypothetical protein
VEERQGLVVLEGRLVWPGGLSKVGDLDAFGVLLACGGFTLEGFHGGLFPLFWELEAGSAVAQLRDTLLERD